MRFHPLRLGVVLLALVCIVSVSWIKSIPGDVGKVICLFIYLSFCIFLSAQKQVVLETMRLVETFETFVETFETNGDKGLVTYCYQSSEERFSNPVPSVKLKSWS